MKVARCRAALYALRIEHYGRHCL